MTISEIRELFPHLKTDQIYFNHAAIGPWSSLALNRINKYSTQRSGEKIENYPFTVKWNASAKEKLGKIIGAPSERIAWVDNVSNGINILAQGLDWKTGDRILLNDLEFPSNVYPFLNLKKLGVEIDIVKTHDGICDIDEIEKAVTTKTKLISISLVQFLSGYRASIDAIGEMCRNKKIIFSVDAIQATGAVQIDVVKSKIDFLSGGSQKWLMSSQGVSYIYLTEELQARMDQKNVGWTSVKDTWNLLDYNLILRDTADTFQNGTMNALGISIFEAVLNMFIDFGMQNVEQRVLENTDYFINRLTEIGIQPILKSIAEKNRAGIVSFKHEDAQKIFEQLEGKRIYTAVREGMLRISPHFYNTKDEIDRLVDELKKIL
jgi:cysteine desulfurase / selenocysteine lyase